ncbi:MAG: hypothetical protein Satyrvirus2_74 [Satyrvirus sp.]|uniref:Ankyrin repeat protein n=1 Tax=Satyrvirus sp. TaxID=2487771 RepID=A0A3G5AGQ0_9VIRU|nr:MAG: hypothetical protein Satyrvirus2_74 [Satyrvirus sp.]
MDPFDQNMIQNIFQNVTRYGEVSEFTKSVNKLKNRDQHTLSSLARYLVCDNRDDMMQILIDDFGFELTDNFMKENITMIVTRPKMRQYINGLTGKDIIELLDNDSIRTAFKGAFWNADEELMVKLINFGFDINSLSYSDKKDIIERIPYYDTFKFIVENGFSLEFVDENILERIVREKNLELLELLVAFGVNINLLNNLKISEKCSKIYNFLTDTDVDPRIIAYLFYKDY